MKYFTKQLWSDYAHIRRILVDSTDTPLFFDPGSGFEDWGYHELSDAADGFLRHEVLFSSGAIVRLEFRDVSVEWSGSTAPILRPRIAPRHRASPDWELGLPWECLGGWSFEVGH